MLDLIRIVKEEKHLSYGRCSRGISNKIVSGTVMHDDIFDRIDYLNIVNVKEHKGDPYE